MYHINTDLTVKGSTTVDRGLLVSGSAVIAQDLTVNGTVQFANATFTQINVTGDANLHNIIADGSITISGDVTGTLSTATFQDIVARRKLTTVDLDSTGTINSKDIVNSANIKTATLTVTDSADIKDLNVTDKISTKDLEASGTTTLTDLVVNGTLSGNYTQDHGQFNRLTVTGTSTLKNVNVTGNVTGNGYAAQFDTINLNGAGGVVQFNYTDSARPGDIKSAIEPYKISTNEIQVNQSDLAYAEIGDVTFVNPGLTAKGKASIDYLDIVGNSTTGSSRPQLTVSGTSRFSGKTTVQDLEITGGITGLSFNDLDVSGDADVAGKISTKDFESTGSAVVKDLTVTGTLDGNYTIANGNFTTITVSGTSNLNAVQLTGNLSGATQTSTFGTYNVAGSNGIVQFSYNDSSRPNDIKTSIQPYKVSTHELHVRQSAIDYLNVGDVTFGAAGLTAKGMATIDYLDIVGNGTTGTNRAQLTVKGKSVLKDLEITGNVTGINFDLTGQDIKLNSLTSDTSVQTATLTTTGNSSLGATTTIKDLVVTGTVTGIQTGGGNIDGTDIAPKNVTASGTLGVTGNSSLGGTTTIKDLVVTGTVSGITTGGNVDGTDIAPKNVTASGTLGVTGISSLKNTTVDGTLNVTGVITPTGGINLSNTNVAAKTITTTGNSTMGANLEVVGDLSVLGKFDLGNVDLEVNSLGSNGAIEVYGTEDNLLPNIVNARITSDLIDVINLNVNGVATLAETTTPKLTVTGATTIDGNITSTKPDIHVTTANLVVDKNLTVTGTFSPAGGFDLTTTDINSKSLTTAQNVHVGGDLTIDGTFDLSATDLSTKSLATPGSVTVGTALVLTSGTVTGSPVVSGTLGVTGATTLSTLAVSGAITKSGAGSLSVESNTVFTKDVTATNVTATGTLRVNGSSTFAGGLDLGSADLTANGLALTANATVGGTLGVTGDSTLKVVTATNVTATGTLRVNGSSTLAAVQATNVTATGTLGVTGATTFGGTLTVNGATAKMKATSVDTLKVGTGTEDANYVVNAFGDAVINGDLSVTGVINAAIDLSSRDISPRNITASGNITTAGSTSVGTTLTAATAIIGAASSTNNNLQINGNTVCTGDFTVNGKIIGTLDQSTSNMTAVSLTTTGAAGVTLGGTGVLTLGSTGAITGSPVISGDLKVNGATTVAALTATGDTVLAGVTATTATLGTATATTLTTTGKATLAGAEISGNTKVENLEITGTLTTNLSDLVTTTIKTNTYYVAPHAAETISTASYTPDGTSNVYNVTLGANTTINPIANVQGAGSWFVYMTQDSTGGRAVTWGSNYSIIGGQVNTDPGAVSICQIVYCGVGSQYDVFIAQRP